MIVSIRVPDELWEAYSVYNPSNPRQAMVDQLKKFKSIDPKDERVMTLDGTNRSRLEKLYGTTIEDMSKFAGWVDSIHSLTDGNGTEFALSQTQLTRLKNEAAFYETPFKDYLKTRVESILRQVLGY